MYSETFMSSGSMRNGGVYERPTWAPHTAGSASSSSPDDADLLGTPTSRMWKGAGPQGGRAVVTDDGRPQGEVLLQTPSVADGMGGHLTRSGARSNEKLLPGQAKELTTDWGPYAPAIHRWECVLGRPAPSPTEPSDAWRRMIARRKARKDPRPVGMRGSIRPQRRLSPRLTEWMMGVPDGWICDTPGVSRNEQLKAAGNGVVPQQAAAALRDMLATFESRGQS